jgi:hypothetical protein
MNSLYKIHVINLLQKHKYSGYVYLTENYLVLKISNFSPHRSL